MAAAKAECSPAPAKPATMRAYMTFLAGAGGEQLEGVVGLAKGLGKVGSAHPLVVAVLPGLPVAHRSILVSQGCTVREVEPVFPPPLENPNPSTVAFDVTNYSKLRIWEFVEYERMVYLDPGMQVLTNIDELFELEKGRFYAVMDCFCDKAWSHTPISYCQRCPDKVACPTAELGLPPYFNAGMFVHEPGMETAKALLDALPPPPFAELQLQKYEDLLNKFFKDVYTPIPIEYSLVLDDKLLTHPENNEQMSSKAKVVRLIKLKPQPFSSGSWLATNKATAFARENLPAMATLAASSAALGVVTNAENPAICFAFYAAFLGAIATVTLSLFRDI